MVITQSSQQIQNKNKKTDVLKYDKQATTSMNVESNEWCS